MVLTMTPGQGYRQEKLRCFFLEVWFQFYLKQSVFMVVRGYLSIANRFTLPIPEKITSAVYLRDGLLTGEHFENQITMWIHEVLDPQNSPVKSRAESTGLASELLKTHPSGVQYPVLISVSHSGFSVVTGCVSSPGRGLTQPGASGP